MTNESPEKRRNHFGCLAKEYHQNVIVQRFIDAYAHQSILSKEEALLQMVKYLACDWTSKEQELIASIRAVPISFSVPEHVLNVAMQPIQAKGKENHEPNA